MSLTCPASDLRSIFSAPSLEKKKLKWLLRQNFRPAEIWLVVALCRLCLWIWHASQKKGWVWLPRKPTVTGTSVSQADVRSRALALLTWETGKQYLFFDFSPPTFPSSHTRMWVFTPAARHSVSITREVVPWAINIQNADSLSKRKFSLVREVRESRTHFQACVETVVSIIARTRMECCWADWLNPGLISGPLTLTDNTVGPAWTWVSRTFHFIVTVIIFPIVLQRTPFFSVLSHKNLAWLAYTQVVMLFTYQLWCGKLIKQPSFKT